MATRAHELAVPIFLVMLTVACTAPTPVPIVDFAASPQDQSGSSSRPSSLASPPFPSMNGHVGAAWIPWADMDLNERPLGTAPSADIEAGEGWAVRGGQYDDALGFEAVLATTTHDESRTGAELTTWSLYADLTDRWELWRGPVSAWAGVGFGFGLVRFDWSSTYKSETSVLWQGEGIVALQLGPNVSVEARAMGFFAGYPTRTTGWGAMSMLGGSISF